MGRRAHGEGTISQRKDGTWEGKVSLGYDEAGKRKRHTVYGKTQKEVRAKLEAIKQQLSSGTFSVTKLTVKSYLEQWLTEVARSVKRSTFEQYEYAVGKLNAQIGRFKLEKLTPMHVQAAIGAIADETGAPTANKCRVVLFSAYKQAIRWQLVTRNPVEAVDPLPVTPREMKLWEPAQAARFLDVASTHRLYAAFYVTMSTGLRRGELLGLRWQDIEGCLLHVRQTRVKLLNGTMIVETPKSKKGQRLVAVSDDVLVVLEAHHIMQETEKSFLGDAWNGGNPDHELVFTSEVGTPVHPDNFRRLRSQLMDKAEVPRVSLHDLRHLHSSFCIKNGMDPATLADRLGHARKSFTLDRYTHFFEAQRAQSAVSILDFLPKSDPENLN